MPRSLVLGNGSLLVCLDANGIVRDLFYDYVGQENHVGGHRHHVGVWIDGSFSWIEDAGWRKEVHYQGESMVGLTVARHDGMGLVLEFHDFVYNEKDVFIRKVVVHNDRDNAREIRMFFAQEFQISETATGNSAFYEPVENIIVHYKGRRVFLVNGRVGKEGIGDYAVGESHHRGLEGTWRDAEDGVLSKNPVSHGSVDSCLGFRFSVPAKSKETVYYWIAAGHSLVEARGLNAYVLDKKPHHLLETTKDFWHAWVHSREYEFWGLSEDIVKLFKTSLLIIRTHVDNKGSIIASADSDFLQHGRDTYAYMWPRDGAFVAKSLDNAGYFENTHEFFKFCNSVIMPEGYLLHKYLCDQSLGSSWHPWVGEGGHPHLPVQEDETALVLHALQNHFERKRDLEFIESIYNSFIKPAANFLDTYRNETTKLPRPSYNLWEEQRAVFTFTCASVYGGLRSAAYFAKLLGKSQQANRYAKSAKEMREGMLKYLYDPSKGYFLKSVRWTDDGKIIRDDTIDASSVFGVMEYDVLPIDDKRLASAWTETKKALWVPPVGGICRYTNDYYYRAKKESPGNAWFICTLWYAQYLIRRAKTEKELEPAREILSWVCKHAQQSGVLSEQLHPDTGMQLSAAPLTWSHATFVLTVIDYLEKIEDLGICDTCLPYRK